MRLELQFDEHEYRYVYQQMHDILIDQEKRTVRSWKSHIFFSYLLFMIFLALGFLNKGWFNFSILSLIYGNIFLLKIVYLKYNNRRIIKSNIKSVELSIDNLKLIKTVFIDFDEREIRYFENGKLELCKSWNDIKGFVNQESFLIFYFDLNDDNDTLLIPKKMSDEKTFELFIELFIQKIRK